MKLSTVRPFVLLRLGQAAAISSSRENTWWGFLTRNSKILNSWAVAALRRPDRQISMRSKSISIAPNKATPFDCTGHPPICSRLVMAFRVNSVGEDEVYQMSRISKTFIKRWVMFMLSELAKRNQSQELSEDDSLFGLNRCSESW